MEKEEGKSYQFGPSNPHNHLVKKFINNFLFQINKVSLTKWKDFPRKLF